ncbi:MAG: CNNM domain-containing protein [Pirellulaceae bacterium]|jgi:CBS domain containing-hemolysin-like protein|nr:CNNM domain-containing protein [Pirellulaceae bacterium]
MTWLIGLLLAVGLFLSALFSGSETGFYRVTRVRLLLGGLDGDRVSHWLLSLTNHPALFVATVLVGNNLANYLTSLSIVLLVQKFSDGSSGPELIATLAASPLVFVYCELLPKQFFYRAPNRLLRRAGPLILFFTVLFAPVAALLWLLGRFLESLIGQTPLRIRLVLARKELQQVLQEGQEAGLLHPAQRELTQRLFANATQNVMKFTMPLTRVASVALGEPKANALRLAARQKMPIVAVRDPTSRQLTGYVRVIELLLRAEPTVMTVHPLPRLPRTETQLSALIHLQSHQAAAAIVEDLNGNPLGLLLADELTDPLFPEN